MNGSTSTDLSPQQATLDSLSRRALLAKGAMGLGAAALATLAQSPAGHALGGGLDHLPSHTPAARRAIYLCMSGAPSQMDLWDHKPEMAKWHDHELPESIRGGQRLTTMTSGQSRYPIAPSQYKFSPHGESQTMVSELLPHLAQQVDQMTLIKSMHTEAINHDPAITCLCTGDTLPGKASIGSWLSYGLGNQADDLPTFVVMTASWTGRRQAQSLFHRLWGSGFLPAQHQGVLLRPEAEKLLYLQNPAGIDRAVRRRMLDALSQLNQQSLQRTGDPQTRARIQQYEMAFRMQTSVPQLADISDEPKHVLDLYGPSVTQPGTYANCCLMARRMAERGVRFTQIFHRGWDQHDHLPTDLPRQCRDVDQASAGLLVDLRQRGMLDDTLVVWGGEFGRTMYCQGDPGRPDYGRDHHPKCFTVWLAGGGVRGGHSYGHTDAFSYNVTENPVHIRDLNATILHQMGIDHQQLSYPFKGLDQKLTGVEQAHVIHDILA